MKNKYQLEYSIDTHEENTVRFSTSIESLTNTIQRMQTTIETMSETIKDKSIENRKIVKAYNEIIRNRTEVFKEDLNWCLLIKIITNQFHYTKLHTS